jgi:hypothetical protein
MKNSHLLLLILVVLAGCATSSNVQTRKQERSASYAALSPEMKTLVDRGQIQIGMPMDAVYIAWGKPAQVIESESPAGASTVWLYHGAWMEETRYWGHRRLLHDYQGRTYVRAEVIFINGIVKSWRTLPQLVY